MPPSCYNLRPLYIPPYVYYDITFFNNKIAFWLQNMCVIFAEQIEVDGIGRYAEFTLDLVLWVF